MVVRMRHTRAHTRNRRSHHALTGPRLSACVKCSAFHLRHRACDVCGTYRGKEVIDVLKKVAKKEKKMKERNSAAAGASKA
ncbi:MAG: 50S ribosomal protein L32 [Candidatus Yonathbacteria bacterium]|nr:50S ribosomal protein L32 [Candidatus Yonathbacteria bacterium]